MSDEEIRESCTRGQKYFSDKRGEEDLELESRGALNRRAPASITLDIETIRNDSRRRSIARLSGGSCAYRGERSTSTFLPLTNVRI